MNQNNNICVNNLVGIPASGKSTICKRLVQLSKSGKLDFNVIHLCYDDLICVKNSADKHKDNRFRVRCLILNILNDIRTGCLFGITDKWCTYEFKKYNFSIEFNPKILNFMLLVDDTMYYKSMRKEIRTIAKSYGSNYFLTYLFVPLDEAIARNQKRQNPLPNHHIEQIYSKMEAPKISEGFTLILNENTKFIDVVEIYYREMLNSITILEETNSKHYSQNGQVEMPNTIHQIDLMLRKEISSQLKTTTLNNKPMLANTLAAKRKCLLNDLRCRTIFIPNNVTDLTTYISLFLLNK